MKLKRAREWTIEELNIIWYLFEWFQYASVCKTIQKDCPLLDKKLQQQDECIDTMCKECWEEVAMVEGQPRSEEEIKRITDTIETNRAKMQHACLEARAAVTVVEEAMKKIKTAFLWWSFDGLCSFFETVPCFIFVWIIFWIRVKRWAFLK